MISEHASPLSALGGVDSGGQNVYVAQLARHLARRGYKVDVFTRRDQAALPEIVEPSDGVRVIHITAGPDAFIRKEEMLPYMDEFTRNLLRFLKRERRRYNLVHANFWMSGLVAADIKRILRIPFVTTFHALGRVRRLYQGKADQFPEARFAIEDRIVLEADAIVAECPQDEQDLIEFYDAAPEKIRMIPAGYDPVEFAPVNKPKAREMLGLDPQERIVLQLGRMVPRKGIETAVRGMARLVQDHGIAARLVIVGGDSDDPDPQVTPEIGRLQTIAAEEGVADRVTFVGRRNRDLLKYFYSAADVFVTLPWYEPFGMTPLEAMACGTPVIGARVGGVKYSVVHNDTGYLVPPRNPAALAEHLAHLFMNPELLGRFGEQALRRARELFTWEGVAGMMAELYEEVMAGTMPKSEEEARQLSLIVRRFDTALHAFQQSQQTLPTAILAAAQTIADCFARGGKVLVCGNGGSAADAQHFAAELVGRFQRPGRRALPALALTADTATVTAWANDMGFDRVFARQVEAFGQPGDVIVGISTSGRSQNVIEALETAGRVAMRRVALLGGDGGQAAALADIPIVVPSSETARIQEVQMLVLHLVCELVEEQITAPVQASRWTLSAVEAKEY